MCWCFPFGTLGPKKSKPPPPEEKRRRRERQHASAPLHGNGIAVVGEVQEKRRSTGSQRTEKRSPRSKTSPTSSRRDREERRPRQDSAYHHDTYRTRGYYERPALNVEVPEMYHREAELGSGNDSTEMLLNPRPHRSPHERRRHPKRTSQTTLRGRGAKRDPPRKSKSKGNMRQPPRQSGWALFLSPPPKTPRREPRYQTYESSPRSHRSPRHHEYDQIPESSSQPQHRHRSSRQHSQPQSSSRHSRSRTPNTAARREPDRRFAVLAATNQALEEVRREAFSQPSPPPRRQRVRRYQGVTVPTSTIPFNWDCVSSSQSAATPRGEDVEPGYVR